MPVPRPALGFSRERIVEKSNVELEVSFEIRIPCSLDRSTAQLASLRGEGRSVGLEEEPLEFADTPGCVGQTEVVAPHEFGAVWGHGCRLRQSARANESAPVLARPSAGPTEARQGDELGGSSTRRRGSAPCLCPTSLRRP